MKTDIELALEAKALPIKDLAESLGIPEDDLSLYGNKKAKISHRLLKKWESRPNGKMVLVTAMHPTPYGEGKTTVSVGLADGLRKIGENAILALREPSLGPAFGIKGGAAGGGLAQVIPMEDINLHFTGDFHAITTANNLLSAMIDNHIHQGNKLRIDPKRIVWQRCMDMNDRSLRNVVVGLGNPADGQVREDHFDITAASELMAILCLSSDLEDLKKRLGEIVVGFNYDKEPVKARDLQAEGAMTLILKEAMDPNLVQTMENTPALVHGGPFANIAHGCNTIVATKLAMKLADYTITEAGFGSDLGAEKFFDIKCRMAGIRPDAVVIVATIRALEHQGGREVKIDYGLEELLKFEEKGLSNLYRHIDNIQDVYGLPVVVAINKFITDSRDEIDLLERALEKKGIKYALAEGWEKGGAGMTDLAKEVLDVCNKDDKKDFRFAYDLDKGLKDKAVELAKKIYHADNVEFSREALAAIKRLEKFGYGQLPICMAKTQYSFSDNEKLLNAPEHFDISIRQVKLSAGAGFVVMLTGAIMTMPGLPKVPAAVNMDIKEDGKIVGLF